MYFFVFFAPSTNLCTCRFAFFSAHILSMELRTSWSIHVLALCSKLNIVLGNGGSQIGSLYMLWCRRGGNRPRVWERTNRPPHGCICYMRARASEISVCHDYSILPLIYYLINDELAICRVLYSTENDEKGEKIPRHDTLTHTQPHRHIIIINHHRSCHSFACQTSIVRIMNISLCHQMVAEDHVEQ